jgi:cyclophilin family peptidyl-prolyl cis-trans isomerase/HEAT repeat protein
MKIVINKILFAAILLFSYSCNDILAQEPVNKFSDPEIRKIHELADHRDSAGLLKYLGHDNPNYQGEALMCLGSVQSAGIADSIAVGLESEMNGVRMAAAFTLGQTFSPDAAVIIRNALDRDTVKLVRGMLFDALGKTGNSDDLKWMAEVDADYQESEGLAQGILRFALRGISLDEANSRMLNILDRGTSFVGLVYASYHLGRYAGTEWLSENLEKMQELYRNESDPVVSANLISAINKGMEDNAGPALETVLNADVDYRIKVNAIKSINEVCWAGVSDLLIKTALSEDPNISVAAAEVIASQAGEENIKDIKRAIRKAVNWRVRSVLFAKALDIVAHDRDRAEKIAWDISEAFLESENTVEKALLIRGLSSYPYSYKFVVSQLNSGRPIIRTYAMETLTGMVSSDLYEKASQDLSAMGVDLNKEFMDIFQTGLKSGDIALVSMASSVLRDKDLPFRAMISDTGFIREALENAGAPEMTEARNEILKTLSELEGKKPEAPTAPTYNHPIDWERVMKIPPRQLVGIVTSKGNIIVQLNVNWCPGTVSAFLELVESGFYDNKIIHRVVPNFVAQDGCPRGDGWGGPPFTIRSEFTPAPFLEGTFGMASAGKDTEGSQWYFTHTATPHLDGKYTNFGRVVEGIEVVHKLEVGDRIDRIVLIENNP